MQVEIKIPSVGESVQEATLAEWFKKEGDLVGKDELLFAIETDKVTLEVAAPSDGVLTIKISQGQTAAIGAVAGLIDTAGIPETTDPPAESKATDSKPAKTPEPPPAPQPPAPGPPTPAPEPAAEKQILSPSVRRLVTEKGIDPARIRGTGPGARVTKSDVILYLEQTSAGPGPEIPPPPPEALAPIDAPASDGITRKPMSRIRRRIAERLVAAKQSTAMLTTFNEIDMSRVMALRSRYKNTFLEKHAVRLGFMSFFTRACVAALMEFPEINAFIEGDDVVYHDYVHMGMAVGSDKGLVVPVIRHAENLSFADIEKQIIALVEKIKSNQLTIADMEGGTFTITNGGVYGSLLSTPILNMPQSGILGLHKIEKRPVVIDDEVVVRPMMYVALSYDHRMVDGREAVSFLKRIKEHTEDPERMMLEV